MAKTITLFGSTLCKRVGLNHIPVAEGEKLPILGGKLLTVIGCTEDGLVKTKEDGSVEASTLRLEWKLNDRNARKVG